MRTRKLCARVSREEEQAVSMRKPVGAIAVRGPRVVALGGGMAGVLLALALVLTLAACLLVSF
jgi:hypothetical protein